jgi:hypothetical protein
MANALGRTVVKYLKRSAKPSPAFQAHVSGAEIAAHRGRDRSLGLHRFRQRPIVLDAEIAKKPDDLIPVAATSPVASSTANDGLRRPHRAGTSTRQGFVAIGRCAAYG